jgi:hypothetical protein
MRDLYLNCLSHQRRETLDIDVHRLRRCQHWYRERLSLRQPRKPLCFQRVFESNCLALALALYPRDGAGDDPLVYGSELVRVETNPISVDVCSRAKPEMLCNVSAEGRSVEGTALA